MTAILVFLSYLYGFGYSLTRFLPSVGFEAFIVRLGVGLGAVPVVGVILNFLHVPLDWRILLVLSLIVPVFDLVKKRFVAGVTQPSCPRAVKFAVLGLFLVHLAVFTWGTFSYPWLEDDDSWNHAAGIKYVALEKNLDAPQGIFQYINPYPPGYDFLFAMLHQVNPSLYWTLKFFNVLIISLGILFFYVFARELTQDSVKALWATFFLTTIPCYLSHFIWAHAMITTLFFPAFYIFLKLEEDKRFLPAAVVIVAGIFLIQPTRSIKFLCLLFLFMAAFCLTRKKFPKFILLSLIAGGMLSLLWWGPVLQRMGSGAFAVTGPNGMSVSYNKPWTFLRTLFEPSSGSATRSYTLNDFLFFDEYSFINNPVGIGIPLCLLTLVGIFVSLRNPVRKDPGKSFVSWLLIFWLAFTFLGVNSKSFNLPVGLFAFRMWMLLAIPVVLLSAETVVAVLGWLKAPLVKLGITAGIVFHVLYFSGYQKFLTNSSEWPWGISWRSPQEMSAYVWLRKNLAPGTGVFAFTDNMFVLGFDMRADFWKDGYRQSLGKAMELDVERLARALKENRFQYVIIGAREVKRFGLDAVKRKCRDLHGSALFRFMGGTKKGAKVFKVL